MHLKRERCHPKATKRAFLSHEETPVRLGSDRGYRTRASQSGEGRFSPPSPRPLLAQGIATATRFLI
jgi:hypothetical protein